MRGMAVNLRKGSVTVEAAIALPVFLCVVISLVFLIKVVYTYELIQHALIETADEIASAGYIYRISGIQEVHDSLREGLQQRADTFRNNVGTIFDTYNSLSELTGSLDNAPDNIGNTVDLINNAKDNFNRMTDAANNAVSNPADELKNIACLIASGAFDDLKTGLFTPVVKLYLKKYLRTDDTADIDKRLKALNIRGGFKGLDFSESGFLEDGNDNIDIIVKYSIDFPLPVKILPDGVFVQRACARAWTGGDEAEGTINNGSEDIWLLDNFPRGLKIREVFGANLPSNFPVIARFDAGTAVMIKSMDLTAESYQHGATVIETLDGYLNELAGYKGQEKPWGSKGIVIRESEIRQKEFVLVIPQNQLSREIEDILAGFVNRSEAEGIKLRIERYGIKKIGS